MSAKGFLLAVADKLDRDGWTQGTFSSPEGACCLIGAMREVSPRLPDGSLAPDRAEGEREVRNFIQRTHGCRSVIGWNDETGRTQTEVTGLLRELANDL